ALHQAQKFTGLKTRSTRWGAAWTLFLNGEWGRAEAFLDEAVKQRPDHPTLLALLSEAQSQRGKSQSALQSARRACAPGLQSKESTKLLINLLLDGGHWREAKEWLLPLEPQACDDTELLLPLVQLNLMQHNQENADKWTAALNAKSSQPETQVQLGHAYEAARQNEKAAGFYERALATAYFPEACLGLGRIQVEARNKAAARQHFLAALNVDRPLGDKAVGPVVLFHQSLRELLMLNEPMLNCRAWVASFGDRASIKVLANQSLMIYALSEQEAEEHLRVLISAMQPGVPPPLPGTIRWREAHHDQQPARAVRSGIQFVFV
ncbi:MAG: Zn-dependent protease with chaperone function, partial [Verrucomicrobiales bacterium]|nr:Zn-dependent protease with chaperone function [Verrucomicrobiales bacterium]